MTDRRRLDAELVRRKLVSSREEAQEAIAAGRVVVSGAPAMKASRLVGASEPVALTAPPRRFASRGGDKLDAALDHFGIDVAGRVVLDAGASTGGFTDCLLQRGARRVLAVDVGYGQLHERLRRDDRVENLERTNVRHLELDEPVELVVADLSFISLTTVADALLGANVVPGGELVVLVKPQFEAGKQEADRGRGIIRDPRIWRRVLGEVRSAIEARGAAMMDVMVSPITGADGNVEFLAHLRAHADRSAVTSLGDGRLDAVVAVAAATVGSAGR